ncbi:MAG TPA: hypothetical protein VKY22_18590 [Bradyrhizobium sp.]|nr:hypothetical protein [Bradyrhizobium sp.]
MRDEQDSQPEAATGMATPRRRRWIGIGLSILALPALALLVLAQLYPDRTVALLDMLLRPLVANTRPPAMFASELAAARGPDRNEINPQLTARLQQDFPLGTTEAALKKALLAQGFKPVEAPRNCVQPVQNGEPLRIDRPVAVCPPQDQSKSLKYEWGSGVCRATVWIRWSTDASEVITLLDGYYNAVCP